MEQTLTRIVSAEKVYQKIKRIAFEIAEDNYDETEIVLAGICKATEGYVFAELLYQELKKITSAHILLTHIELDKQDPGNSTVDLNLTEEEIDNKTIINIEDRGLGIKPEIMDRIFDPFFTTKPAGEGTGLGLSICRGLVEAHGGTLTAFNKETGGVAFTIRLPANSVPPPVREAAL